MKRSIYRLFCRNTLCGTCKHNPGTNTAYQQILCTDVHCRLDRLILISSPKHIMSCHSIHTTNRQTAARFVCRAWFIPAWQLHCIQPSYTAPSPIPAPTPASCPATHKPIQNPQRNQHDVSSQKTKARPTLSAFVFFFLLMMR